MGTAKATIEALKIKYLAYYEDVPIQKYAAMAIARDEDTVIRWRKEDAEFADAVQIAKAKWIRKKVLSSKAEFALERLEKEIFGKNPTASQQTFPTVALVEFIGDGEDQNDLDNTKYSPH